MPKSYYYDGVKRFSFSSGSPVNEVADVTAITLVDKIITTAVAEEIVDAVLEEALQLVYLSCQKGLPCREAAPPGAPVGDIPQLPFPLECEIKKMISNISAQTAIVGQGDVEAPLVSSEELRRLVVMVEESKESPVRPAHPTEFPVNEKEVLETKDSWEEEEELEVRVIEPDYDSTCDEGSLQLQLPKQRMFWSSTGLVIGKDMMEEIVARAENLMFPQPEEEPLQEWVVVQDGGKGDEKDLVPSETPSCSSEDSPKKKTKGKKWKLGVRMRKFFSTALGRNSKSERAAVVKQ